MRKILAAIVVGMFAVTATSAFAAAHAKGEKGDKKEEMKKDAKK